jgi:hypothetical protein
MNIDAKTRYAQDLRRWRERMEHLGLEVVRVRFAQGIPTIDKPPYPPPDVVADWIGEQETAAQRVEDRRFQIIRRWTIAAAVAGIVAAIGALVAAWPVIKEWLPPF